MPHTKSIKDAFRNPVMQQILGIAIERVPEIKHESLICTALAAILNGTDSNARREAKQTNTRRGRRVDIRFTRNGMTLEAKYHLDFDLPSVTLAQKNWDQVKAKVIRLGRHGSWNAGEAVVHELCRVDNSYFLWSVCSRGSPPVPSACMADNSYRWIAGLPRHSRDNIHEYVEQEFNNLSRMLAGKANLKSEALQPIRQNHSVIFSTLFYRA